MLLFSSLLYFIHISPQSLAPNNDIVSCQVKPHAFKSVCMHGVSSSVSELLCRSASCGIVHLVSTWTVLLYWQTARRELGCMNPLILELLNLFAV